MILSSQSASIQGKDLMQPDNLEYFINTVNPIDFAYSLMEIGLSIISTSPNQLIFSGSHFQKMYGISKIKGAEIGFFDWFRQESETETRRLLDVLIPMFYRLAATNDTTGRSYIQLDYSRFSKQLQPIRVDERITPLYFLQKQPQNLFWCTTKNVDHLRLPFSYNFILVIEDKIIEKARLCPSFHKHPLLQNLSPTERKVLQKLFDLKESKDIAEELNMGIETIRSHRKSIIRKTGFRSTDAAVEVLRRDFFG